MEHHQAILLAEQYVRWKRGERALEMLKHASPDDAATWLWRANALHVLKRYDDAMDAVRKGLALAPENPWLHHAMARSLFQEKRLEEAEQAILESLRLYPDDAEAHAVHAMILAGMSKPEKAQKVMAHAVELNPELPSVRLLHTFLTLNRDSVHERTRELLNDDPEGAAQHWLNGIALVKIGRLREASNHFARAVALEPETDLFVKTARNSRHWIFWPLRVTSPLSLWVARVIVPIMLMTAIYGMMPWTYFWYSVAYALYAFIATLATVALPLAKE